MREEREVIPHVSIVVFSRDSKDALVRCLTSIARLEYPNVTVFLADNGSTSFDPHAVESLFEGLILLENEGYPEAARGKNVALARILKMRRTEFVLLLDEDTIVHPRLVSRLVEMHDPQRAWDILQPAVYDLDDPESLYCYGGRFHPFTGRVSLNGKMPPVVDPADEAARIDVAFGFALFTHRNVLDTVGRFDEWLFPDDSDDVDFCLRASSRSYGVAVLSDAIVWLAGGSRRSGKGGTHEAFVRAQSRSLLVRRFGRHRHRLLYLVVGPVLGAASLVGQTLRGHPAVGLASAMGRLRGMTRSVRRSEPQEPEEPESGWGALPDKGQGPVSPR